MKRKTVTLTNAITVFVLVLTTTTTVVARTVLYVDLRAPFGTTDHGSWETAYNCLQEALSDARAGDEIRVAQGTYMPDRRWGASGRSGIATDITASGSRSASFSLHPGVVMKGSYAGLGAPDPNARDIDAHPSILSGDLLGNDPNLMDLAWQTLADFTSPTFLDDNSYTVVTLVSGSEDTVLDGFTVTGAYSEKGRSGYEADGFIVPSIGGRSVSAGGAAWINGGRPVVSRCTFTRNVTRSRNDVTCGGAALFCADSQATIRECSFIENIAFADGIVSTGGAVLNVSSEPNLIDCTFIRNIATGQNGQCVGGAIAGFYSSPRLAGCSFIENRAFGPEGDTGFMAGGAVFHHGDSRPSLTDCTFTNNWADAGGAIYSQQSCDANLADCTFEGNTAASLGGALAYGASCDSVLSRCDFLANTAGHGVGGAVATAADCNTAAFNCRFLGNLAATGAVWDESANGMLTNCLFSGNAPQLGAVLRSGPFSDLFVVNCTFASNGSGPYAATHEGLESSTAQFVNCILWDDNLLQTPLSAAQVLDVRYSNVRSGWPGTRNFNEAPCFLDPLGPDGVAGTLDDNLRVPLGSPGLDAGDDLAVPPGVSVDLDGQPRIVNSAVDMGAYEYNGPLDYYVDGLNGSDTNGGWAPEVAFASIQKGIDTARDGYRVIVLPGTYTEEINFTGKALTVMGSGGAPLLEAPGGYAVSCFMAETRASVLKNFVIRRSDVGIFLAGASPTIRNVTLADNKFGIAAYAGSKPDINSCILWGNAAGDLFDCTARFSCIQQGELGEGNISEDPLFGDPANGDYHLFSEGGRYVPAYGLWSFDPVTSPCVDAGDPGIEPGAERFPNGGRINMGAFGGTPEASMSMCVPCIVR